MPVAKGEINTRRPARFSAAPLALLLLAPAILGLSEFDPRTDHVYIAGWDGDDEPPNIMVNGDSLPAPVEMAFGTKHRLRFINIGVAVPVRFSIRRDTTFVTWKALAKDGADLPASQATVRRAVQVVVVGETYDLEFDPPTRGDLHPGDREPCGAGRGEAMAAHRRPLMRCWIPFHVRGGGG